MGGGAVISVLANSQSGSDQYLDLFLSGREFNLQSRLQSPTGFTLMIFQFIMVSVFVASGVEFE